jgi:hypothetical protein
MRLAVLQHLTVQQSSERLGGALEDCTDSVAVLNCREPTRQQIQVSGWLILHARQSRCAQIEWHSAAALLMRVLH